MHGAREVRLSGLWKHRLLPVRELWSPLLRESRSRGDPDTNIVLPLLWMSTLVMMSVLHGLSNITKQSVLNSQAERLKSSAARPADKLEAVVLSGLLADRE